VFRIPAPHSPIPGETSTTSTSANPGSRNGLIGQVLTFGGDLRERALVTGLATG
jgi:hypothetical protein